MRIVDHEASHRTSHKLRLGVQLIFVNIDGLQIGTRKNGVTSIVKDYDVRLFEMVKKGMEIGEMQTTAGEVGALDTISEKYLGQVTNNLNYVVTFKRWHTIIGFGRRRIKTIRS